MVKHPTSDIIHETSANFNSFFVILQNMYFLLRTDGFYSKTHKQRNSFLVDIPLAKSPKLGIVEKAVDTMWVCVEISSPLGAAKPGSNSNAHFFFPTDYPFRFPAPVFLSPSLSPSPPVSIPISFFLSFPIPIGYQGDTKRYGRIGVKKDAPPTRPRPSLPVWPHAAP